MTFIKSPAPYLLLLVSVISIVVISHLFLDKRVNSPMKISISKQENAPEFLVLNDDLVFESTGVKD
ncbi:MAG: hypothetical protein AAGH46_08925 [Bacteroidota bacterium]